MMNIETTPLATFTEKAYLDYSMYVILDRALPHIADGLKPVQRRIVYAMSELGLHAIAKHKKSARTVGDVLGKFHPHGDTACYEAMVLMAQPFSYRYPLIDGQGNFGSPDDPKSFAAMRYTESRLSPYADMLLSELKQGTTDWVDNFDGSLEEPSLLPARLPNVLLNGATGIAVGMASDILPHNLKEVANACMALLCNPESTLEDILSHIQGPDFPTEAEIITPTEQIRALYASGNGSIKMRAVYRIVDHHIIIHALPYQVSGSRVIEQIAAQMQQKKIPMVEDLRDESNHETPTRIVIIPRSNRVDLDELMSHLFATTDLERNYRVNFNIVGLNGRPQVKNLLTILQEWLTFRKTTVTRRLQHRLAKVLDRIHILEGFMIAFLHLDEIIAIIRESDAPKSVLMARYALSERQAEAILEIKLRQLAKLEEIKLQGELDTLAIERQKLEAILANPSALAELIHTEIQSDRDTFGDARRSRIVMREDARAMSEIQIINNEPLTVILSEKGWIRAAKGHEVQGKDLGYKAGDQFKAQIHTRSHLPVIFFDSEGKVYNLPAHTLPSARGQGEPLTGRLNPADGISFEALVAGNPGEAIVLATSQGYGFICNIDDLLVKNRNGKACIRIPQGAQLLTPRRIQNPATDRIACISSDGRLLVFPAQALPVLARGKGNRIMSLPSVPDEPALQLRDLHVLGSDQSLIVCTSQRQYTIKAKDLEHYAGDRGRRGNRLPRGLLSATSIEVM